MSSELMQSVDQLHTDELNDSMEDGEALQVQQEETVVTSEPSQEQQQQQQLDQKPSHDIES